jgi:hypothetical protein
MNSGQDDNQEPLIEDVETVDAEEAEEIEHPIGKAIGVYVEHSDSLFKTFFLTMRTISRTHKKMLSILDEFEVKHCEKLESDNGENYTIKIPENYFRRWTKINQEIKQISLSAKLVPASFMSSLISQYDAFLGQLIKVLFDLNPEMLNASERNLSYAQLAEFDSIPEAREYIVEKEIETVLRKSHSEQFDWLEKKFDLPLRKDLSIWPVFIEVTERRNLFVHTRGIVSSQYIKVCKQHNVALPADIKVGSELHASIDYMVEAHSCIFDMGVQLAHVLWRKKSPQTRNDADDNLNEIIFELLLDRSYKLAIRIADFAVNTLKRFSSEQIRRMLVVNRALAYKWSGNEKTAVKIINVEDWTATADQFKLAESVILEDYNEADAIVKRIGNNGSVSAQAYREWPLFLKYRERDEFKQIFKQVFNEEFDMVEETEGSESNEQTDNIQNSDNKTAGE